MGNDQILQIMLAYLKKMFLGNSVTHFKLPFKSEIAGRKICPKCST